MLVFVLVVCFLQSVHTSYAPNRRQIRHVDSLVRRWAPLVWLAPGERFFPGGVEQFLENVVPTAPKETDQLRLADKSVVKKNISNSRDSREKNGLCGNACELNLEEEISLQKDSKTLPLGSHSKDWFLTPKEDIGRLLQNSSSFIHGYNPLYYSVPVYAIISHCPPQKGSKLPIPSHISQHIQLKPLRTSIKKQKEDTTEDSLGVKQRSNHERDKNSYSPILNSGEIQPNKLPFNTQGYTDENIEVGNKLGPFKIHLRKRDTSKDALHRVQGPSFTVTYWLFFPFSEGKDVCVVETGPRLLGPWPLPLLGGHCLGKRRRYGSHLGDWEHLSIQFVNGHPQSLYISTHKLGAYYKFLNQGLFRLYRHELREGGHVEGWLQRPRFPPAVYLTKPLQATPGPNIPNSSRVSNDAAWMRPTLFAAKGSHGLWAAPGHHEYVKYPQLEDNAGYGTPWETWTNLQILHKTKEHQSTCLVEKKREEKFENHANEHQNVSQKGKSFIKTVDSTTEVVMDNNNAVDGEGEKDCKVRSEWPSWMSYEGHWGETRKGCHEALSKLGVGGWSCEYSDGPRGIPAKRSHYSCNQL